MRFDADFIYHFGFKNLNARSPNIITSLWSLNFPLSNNGSVYLICDLLDYLFFGKCYLAQIQELKSEHKWHGQSRSAQTQFILYLLEFISSKQKKILFFLSKQKRNCHGQLHLKVCKFWWLFNCFCSPKPTPRIFIVPVLPFSIWVCNHRSRLLQHLLRPSRTVTIDIGEARVAPIWAPTTASFLANWERRRW